MARRELDRGLLHALLVARPRRQDLEDREIAIGLAPKELRRRDLSVRDPGEHVGAATAPARSELEDARAARVAEQARRREELAERRLLARTLLPARAARIDAGPESRRGRGTPCGCASGAGSRPWARGARASRARAAPRSPCARPGSRGRAWPTGRRARWPAPTSRRSPGSPRVAPGARRPGARGPPPPRAQASCRRDGAARAPRSRRDRRRRRRCGALRSAPPRAPPRASRHRGRPAPVSPAHRR